MAKVKVGVIGTGKMGKYHVDCYSDLSSNCRLMGVFDKHQDKSKKIAQKYGIKAYKSALELIQEVDAVNIVTPTSTHFKLALKAVGFNKHIMMEKPITSSLQEADSLLQKVKEKNLILQVGHIERFNPVIKALPDLFKKEEIIAVESRRMGPYDPRIYDTDVIQDLMIHDIDIINYLLPGSIQEITAHGLAVKSQDYVDYATADIVMDNGIIAGLTASRVTNKKLRYLTLTTLSSCIEIDYLNRSINVSSQAESNSDSEDYQINKNLDKNENPLKSELKHFINCIKNQDEPQVSGIDGFQALQITKKIQDKIYNK